MALLDSLPVDILAVTETWLTDATANQIHIPGYSFIYSCRPSGRGGGVGFFIKTHIKCNLMDIPKNQFDHSTYESLFVRFSLPNGSY